MKRSWLVASTEQVVAARVKETTKFHVRALDAAVGGETLHKLQIRRNDEPSQSL